VNFAFTFQRAQTIGLVVDFGLVRKGKGRILLFLKKKKQKDFL
jgi:hypothetical protein